MIQVLAFNFCHVTHIKVDFWELYPLFLFRGRGQALDFDGFLTLFFKMLSSLTVIMEDVIQGMLFLEQEGWNHTWYMPNFTFTSSAKDCPCEFVKPPLLFSTKQTLHTLWLPLWDSFC